MASFFLLLLWRQASSVDIADDEIDVTKEGGEAFPGREEREI